MKTRFKHIIPFLLVISSFNVKAQVSLNFNTSLFAKSLDGLAFTQVTNSSNQAVYAKFNIIIREITQGVIVSVRVPYIFLRPGINTFNNQVLAQSSIVFAQNTLARQLSQTGKFGEGDYEFCFEVTEGDPKTQQVYDVNEFCFQSMIEPAGPLLLINPGPGDQFCNTRPDLTWQPPIPLQRNIQYRVMLFEKKENQQDVEAVTYNLPIINVAGLFTNTLLYPSKTPDLQKGKKYVWQVTAYQDKTILTKSDIWEFEIKCDEPPVFTGSDTYRELKETDQGGFYMAYGILKFSLINPYNAGDLDYTITGVTKSGEPISDLPKLKLQPGLNKFDVDLTENRHFKNDNEYILTVKMTGNKQLHLRFIYKNPMKF